MSIRRELTGVVVPAAGLVGAGERKISALELMRLADALDVPLAHFVNTSPRSVVSRRTGLDDDSDTASRQRYRLDTLLEQRARDAEWLVDHGFLRPPEPFQAPRNVSDEAGARRLAQQARAYINLASEPVGPLATVAESFGLYLVAVDQEADGASLMLDGWGVAVIGGHAEPGRRRWTAAHELGHHLFQDAYHTDVGVAASRDAREHLIDCFVSEFLLPSAHLRVQMRADARGAARDILIGLAHDFRVSWSGVVTATLQLGVITSGEARQLRANSPVRGDFLAVRGSEPQPDLDVGVTGEAWTQAVLAAWHHGSITANRVVELLNDTITADELPSRSLGDCLP